MIITMPRLLSIGVSVGFLAVAGQAAADDVQSIVTGGKGDLTMCSYRGCNLYHHIELPPRMAIGTKVHVRFGSNTKRYDFPVAWIVLDGNTCTVFSQTDQTEDVNKIEIAYCQAGPGAP
jgi:hypothetical protein